MSLEVQRPSATATPLTPSRRMRAKFLREVADAGLSPGPTEPRGPVTEADLAALPAVVRRYLRFMGVVGRPRTWSFRLRSQGAFRMAPDGPWLPCEAWQYNSALSVARIFHMRLRMGKLVPVLVRDTYVAGHGRMRGRVLDAVSVVDEANAKIDAGELVTYVNDAILLAPSMLLCQAVSWEAVDEGAFDVTLADRGASVRARVFVDEQGRPTDFSTTDRFGTDPHGSKEMVRARWSTPVRGWDLLGGRAVATGGTAVWHFASGDFAYADFDFADLELDVPPAQREESGFAGA